eukprot:1240352-Amphidinium_carterae.1
MRRNATHYLKPITRLDKANFAKKSCTSLVTRLSVSSACHFSDRFVYTQYFHCQIIHPCVSFSATVFVFDGVDAPSARTERKLGDCPRGGTVIPDFNRCTRAIDIIVLLR